MITNFPFFIFFLFCITAVPKLSSLEINKTPNSPWNQKDSLAFFSKHLPINTDGKIYISSDIRHIKLDIGLSWCAPMTQAWLAKQEDLLVFGFEPNVFAVEMIKQGSKVPNEWAKDYIAFDNSIRQQSSLPLYLGNRFYLLPCALGISHQKTMPFYVTEGDCGCSSLFFPKALNVSSVVEVPVLSLSNFFDIFPFESFPIIDYIKIDAQGADLDIAKSAGHYFSKHVVCISLEPENDQYAGTMNSMQHIENYMDSISFIRYYSRNTQDPTFVNKFFLNYFIENNELSIFQEG
jgi:hypothetical protein